MAMLTVSAPYASSTQLQYQTWGQALGKALSSFGWVKQTGHGEQTDNGGTGTGYAWTGTPNVGTLASAPLPVQSYTFKGAWVSGNTYVGANAANSATAVDVVTDGGLTYIHITATSNLATAPGADTTNWQPFVFEIWKTNGPMSATFAIYLKVVYTWNSTSLTPTMWFIIGTGVDVNGNLTGTANWAPAAPTYIFGTVGNAASLSTTNFDCVFSGDADNIRLCMFKTLSGNSAGLPAVFTINRAKTASGSDSDAFIYIAVSAPGSMTPSGGTSRSAIFLKPALGTLVSVDSTRWGGIVCGTNPANANFGAIPPFPVFPVVGYLANPLLGIMSFGRTDVSEGAIVPVWMYGASHNYLVIGNQVGGVSPDGTTSRAYSAILWE